MGSIQNFGLTDFLVALDRKVGAEGRDTIDKNAKDLSSIFFKAAKNDGGEDKEVYETDGDEFSKFVEKAAEWVKERMENSETVKHGRKAVKEFFKGFKTDE